MDASNEIVELLTTFLKCPEGLCFANVQLFRGRFEAEFNSCGVKFML